MKFPISPLEENINCDKQATIAETPSLRKIINTIN
jgi:hypothetical protein